MGGRHMPHFITIRARGPLERGRSRSRGRPHQGLERRWDPEGGVDLKQGAGHGRKEHCEQAQAASATAVRRPSHRGSGHAATGSRQKGTHTARTHKVAKRVREAASTARRAADKRSESVSYTHLTLPTTPYV